MALQSSGKITLNEIATEFEDTAPHSLKEFYGVASGIPSSGTITIKDFYGASNAYSFTMASGDIQEANIRSLAVADGWDEDVPLIVTINSGTTLYSRSTSTGGAIVSGSFPNGVTILNSGAITGMGGSAGQNGGPALQITTSDSVTVTNNSGAFIAGGGGGGAASQGGGGAGQSLPRVSTAGVGGPYTTTTGISGTLAVFGCSEGGTCVVTGSCTVSVSGNAGYGADQGAYAGSGTTSGGCCSASGTGSSGTGCTCSASGTLCGGGGTLNSGGTGGSVLSATSNVTNSGGGWGAAGTGTGAGSGGAAISGTYATLTNNGTIYGST